MIESKTRQLQAHAAKRDLASSADTDPEETREWLDALDGIIRQVGAHRARFILEQLEARASECGIASRAHPYSAYQNTISLAEQLPHPGDVHLEERIAALIRWNALAMVARANKQQSELGGHLASYASAAEIFEIGFNHFFRARIEGGPGDLVFFQPHSAPGVYARAFLEGRLTEEQLANYRQEVAGKGLCSYCHPWLMPDFWQFPTGSMGLGSIFSIYQARFMRYLEHRKLLGTSARHVWGIFGDGEMDEPESTAALTLAAREQLDNLTFVINCNLQRLDGPVRGNGQIIQELEALFQGAGWRVIKVLWGSDWDVLFFRDAGHALLHQFANMVDGEFQTLGAKDGLYNQSHFFALDPQLQSLAAHMSADQIDALKRGGHDFRKLYAAFAEARSTRGQPAVILAKTKKGYGLGRAGESRMTAHQEKKLDLDALRLFRDRFAIPLDDEGLAQLRFLKPAEHSPEMQYLQERRRALGGYLPARFHRTASPSEAGGATAADISSNETSLPIVLPPLGSYATFALAADGKEMSITMAFTRMLTNLLRDKSLGPRIVPIVADEARTFGMTNLFKQIGIYSHCGQLYEPEDTDSLLAYRESREGQLLEEGITEAGAMSSWVAAATSYSVHEFPMLPFYIFYSMFGFQRVGDLIWAAADQRARGFLLGATAGRTTLSGEGLQHQDGSSHVVAATVPTCRAYDPAFAYELAVILEHGMRRMLEQQVDEFYYITVMNESYPQPALPTESTAEVIEGIQRGAYRYKVVTAPELQQNRGTAAPAGTVRLLGSGSILREVIAAAELLATDWGCTSEIWSITSFSELAREARATQRWNRLHPDQPPRVSYIDRAFAGCSGPIVAASDYVSAYPQLICPYLSQPFLALGTDGFGRSDTRVRLRSFFEVNRFHITVAALWALSQQALVPAARAAEAITKYGIDPASEAPWLR